MKNVLIIGASGYIGNTLKQFLINHKIQSTTTDIKWFYGPSVDIVDDYKNLEKEILSKFSHIVLLAGHSSVAMCKGNYRAAWSNNVTNFSNLISKLDKHQTLIYASSGSVYGDGGENRKETSILENALNEYDLTKQVIEKISTGANCKTIGLRLGTLNGFSEFARSDLLLNAMLISAKKNEEIHCFNGNNFRSVLGINDCVKSIKMLVDNDVHLNQHEIFNLASFSGQIKKIAELVGNILNVPVIHHDEVTNKFSFVLNCQKFESTFSYKFNDTPENIILELSNRFDEIYWSERVESINYV